MLDWGSGFEDRIIDIHADGRWNHRIKFFVGTPKSCAGIRSSTKYFFVQMHEKVSLPKIDQIASTVKSPSVHGLIGCDHSLAIWLWGHIYIFSPFGVYSNAHCQRLPYKKFSTWLWNWRRKNINENSSKAADCGGVMNEKGDGSWVATYSNSGYFKLTSVLISSHSANTTKYFLGYFFSFSTTHTTLALVLFALKYFVQVFLCLSIDKNIFRDFSFKAPPKLKVSSRESSLCLTTSFFRVSFSLLRFSTQNNAKH